VTRWNGIVALRTKWGKRKGYGGQRQRRVQIKSEEGKPQLRKKKKGKKIIALNKETSGWKIHKENPGERREGKGKKARLSHLGKIIITATEGGGAGKHKRERKSLEKGQKTVG